MTQQSELTRDGKRPLKHARFCCSGCRSGYMSDLHHGLPYGQQRVELDTGAWHVMNWTEAARWTRECPYCGADVSSPKVLREQGLNPVSY